MLYDEIAIYFVKFYYEINGYYNHEEHFFKLFFRCFSLIVSLPNALYAERGGNGSVFCQCIHPEAITCSPW